MKKLILLFILLGSSIVQANPQQITEQRTQIETAVRLGFVEKQQADLKNDLYKRQEMLERKIDEANSERSNIVVV